MMGVSWVRIHNRINCKMIDFMKSKVYVFIILFSSFNLYSQIKIDAVSIFKMQLFLDKNDIELGKFDLTTVKSDSLYKAFNEIVDLRIDTLKITGDHYLTKSALSPKYTFFQLTSHSYKKKLSEKELQLYWIFGDHVCTIAINQETGKSYRLLGFNTNDFLSFLSDFREEFKIKQGEKLTVKHFLKNYIVEDVDFECLYNGLRSGEADTKSYPCLVKASDPVWIR